MSETTVENAHIKSIAEIVADYQGGDVMTPERILQWVEQFDEQDHEVILAEMAHILKQTYVSKNNAKEYLSSLFNDNQIVQDFENNYSKVNFLNNQTRGQSQKELLELLDEVLVEKFGVYTEECGKTHSEITTYIYIDDCFFTGNRVHRDIERWIENAKPGTALHTIFFGLHEKDFHYKVEIIKKLLKDKQISLNVWYFKQFKMDSFAKGRYESCWPAYIEGDPDIDSFVETLQKLREERKYKQFSLFRDSDKPYTESFFSSKEARNQVEQAFLKKGIEIFNLPENPNHSMMPMGYNPTLNLGFGSIFVTYRNVPNNCPLVLWWGDLEKRHPLNQWLPLFPRKTNNLD